VPVGIAAIGGVALIALYRRLRTTWRPTALFGLLSVVWCFMTPYSHGNDALLFVPGALALGAALLASFTQSLAQAETPRIYSFQLLKRSASLVTVTLAIATLWLGPSLHLLQFWIQNLSLSVAVVVAPLLILTAFVATESLHWREPQHLSVSAMAAMSNPPAR
jgi:hypothetical protein